MDNLKSRDWTGNSKSIYVTLGASNHVEEQRQQDDYYATHPSATEWLCRLETFSKDVLEPACGEGHISKVLEKHGYNVESFDLVDRGFGKGGVDFLQYNEVVDKDIVSNPPYSLASSFVEHAMEIITDGHKVAMFLKLQFLEGKDRAKMFKKYPPKTIYVSSSRIPCGKNGDFYDRDKEGNVKYDKNGNPKEISSAVAYGWYVWEKGFVGKPTIEWFN